MDGRLARAPAALLRWYAAARRPLPWRRSRDPYRIWVAEVLLQQTRVAQAAPYFERFVATFPNVRALASARPADVLKVWQGAGYYARARHLHAAARRIIHDHGGRLPRSVGELERLPGVGPYTARAIASLAFGAPEVALEANGLRIAARWTLERGDPRRPAVRDRLARRLRAILPVARAGAFNEALMELGETVCLPAHPRCGRCPVAFACRARAELPDPGSVPARRRRPRRPTVRGAVVVLTDPGGRWLVQRRPLTGLLGGLWEFPGGKIDRGERPQAAARRELREETGHTVDRLEPVGVVRHAYSHFAVLLHVFTGRARRPGRGPPTGLRRWVTPAEMAKLPVPRATEKIWERLAAVSGAPFPGGSSGPTAARSIGGPARAGRERRAAHRPGGRPRPRTPRS